MSAVWHSGKERAAQTATILHQALGGTVVEQRDGLKCSVEIELKWIEGQSDEDISVS